MRVESSKVRGSICLFFSFTDAYDTLKSIKNHDIQKSTFWLPMEYRKTLYIEFYMPKPSRNMTINYRFTTFTSNINIV